MEKKDLEEIFKDSRYSASRVNLQLFIKVADKNGYGRISIGECIRQHCLLENLIIERFLNEALNY